MRLGQILGVKGAESVYLTVGDHFVHSFARLSALPLAGVL